MGLLQLYYRTETNYQMVTIYGDIAFRSNCTELSIFNAQAHNALLLTDAPTETHVQHH